MNEPSMKDVYRKVKNGLNLQFAHSNYEDEEWDMMREKDIYLMSTNFVDDTSVLERKTVINGHARFDGNAELVAPLAVLGDLMVTGEAELFDKVFVIGDILTFGDVDVCDDLRTSGGLYATNNAEFGHLAVVGDASFGDLVVEGDLYIGELPECEGNVISFNEETPFRNIKYGPLVTVNEEITVKNKVQVNGSAILSGRVSIANNLTVKGSIFVVSDFDKISDMIYELSMLTFDLDCPFVESLM